MKNKKSIVVRGAREHNLKNITVKFPLKILTCVTGVSGSGKSTLVEEILYKPLASRIMRSLDRPGKHSEIVGAEYINKAIMRPAARSSRDLMVWQKAHEFVLAVYRFTESFPYREKFVIGGEKRSHFRRAKAAPVAPANHPSAGTR